jgi:hypothetical protein
LSLISRGYSLTDGLTNDYTNTHLHMLVDNATVTSIPLSEFATSSKLIQVSATTPVSDQGDGSLWYDSALGILRTKNANTRWDCQYMGPEMTNSGGTWGTLPKGTLVVTNGDNTVAPCVTGMWPEALGVLVSTLVSGAKGIVQTKGDSLVRVFGPVTIGDVLISGGNVVFAGGSGTSRTLHATGVSTATMGVAIGQAFGSCASGFTALISARMWR